MSYGEVAKRAIEDTRVIYDQNRGLIAAVDTDVANFVRSYRPSADMVDTSRKPRLLTKEAIVTYYMSRLASLDADLSSRLGENLRAMVGCIGRFCAISFFEDSRIEDSPSLAAEEDDQSEKYQVKVLAAGLEPSVEVAMRHGLPVVPALEVIALGHVDFVTRPGVSLNPEPEVGLGTMIIAWGAISSFEVE